jgi:uncharacterized protein (DUF342 family)
MIIRGESINDAINKGMKIYKCKADDLKVHTIKEPRYALFGLVKKQGEYRVELARVKRKETCGTKNKDGYIEIVSGKAVVADPVEVGQVLAIKEIHTIPEKDGETVTGKIVKAKPAKEIPFKAGKGTVLMDRDTKIVASCSGRPMLSKGTVSVLPYYVIHGDVCPETGNVYFNGDVHIKGSVMDNMKVVVDGNITVTGNVLQAILIAGGSVTIRGNIISSSITAGAAMVNSLCVMPKIKEILRNIKKDFYDVNSEVWLNGYQKMKERYPSLYSERKRSLDKIAEDIKEVSRFLTDEDYETVKEILEEARIIYAAGNLANAGQINRIRGRIQEYLAKTSVNEGTDADIKLGYAQNSTVQASGDVLVLGRGTYQTDVIAKKAIRFVKPSSVVLGGTLIAGERISLGTVGSPHGITTHCKVLGRNGRIDAVRLFNNTVITINNKKKII